LKNEYLVPFPDDYTTFYSEKVRDWWSYIDYAELFSENFRELLLKNNKEGDLLAIVFASKKLGGGENYALLYIPVAIEIEDVQMRGVKHIGTFKNPPNRITKNAAYITMLTDESLNNYKYGNRMYIGTTEKISEVKEIIVAWVEGLITPTGSLPDYDYVEMF
tara:strand:- start:12438 stop:12923 length:486 start_codon:yes stop_codon:yes gene_type:complete